jgi:hypothetical protein
MNHYAIFALGCFLGAFLGLFVASLCIAARDADDSSGDY